MGELQAFERRLDLAPTTDVMPHPIGMVVNRPTGALRFASPREMDDTMDGKLGENHIRGRDRR